MIYLITNKDSSVAIMDVVEGHTPEECIKKWSANEREKVAWVRLLEKIPTFEDRKYRNAWVDVTPESCIDISHDKVKELCLEKMREKRNKVLADTDIELVKALEKNNTIELELLKDKRQKLRDCTESLKLFTASGYNDPDIIKQIESLSKVLI